MQKPNPYLSNNLTGLLYAERKLLARTEKFAVAAERGNPEAVRKFNRNRDRLDLIRDAIAAWFEHYYISGEAVA